MNNNLNEIYEKGIQSNFNLKFIKRFIFIVLPLILIGYCTFSGWKHTAGISLKGMLLDMLGAPNAQSLGLSEEEVDELVLLVECTLYMPPRTENGIDSLITQTDLEGFSMYSMDPVLANIDYFCNAANLLSISFDMNSWFNNESYIYTFLQRVAPQNTGKIKDYVDGLMLQFPNARGLTLHFRLRINGRYVRNSDDRYRNDTIMLDTDVFAIDNYGNRLNAGGIGLSVHPNEISGLLQNIQP